MSQTGDGGHHPLLSASMVEFLLFILTLTALFFALSAQGEMKRLREELEELRQSIRQARQVHQIHSKDPAQQRLPNPWAGDFPNPPSGPEKSPPPIVPPVPPETVVPPPLPELSTKAPSPQEKPFASSPRPEAPPFQWQDFIGAKLFAWVGGFALFVGIALAIKYSFDNQLLSPVTRLILGTVLGLAFMGGGLMVKRRTTVATSHSLISVGILVLYFNVFAAYGLHRILSLGTASLCAGVVTVAAFLLADRLRALPVAILGLVGGFASIGFLAFEHRVALPFYPFLALLDVALLALALKRTEKGWNTLPLLAALGTLAVQIFWREYHLHPMATAVAIDVAFVLLFAAAAFVGSRRASSALLRTIDGAFILGFYAFWGLALAIWESSRSPLLTLGSLFVTGVVLQALTLLHPTRRGGLTLTSLLFFGILALWIGNHPASLYLSMGAVLLSTGIHAYFNYRSRLLFPERSGWELGWEIAFPGLALLTLLIPVMHQAELSFLLLPVIGLVVLIGAIMALLTGVFTGFFILLAATTFLVGRALWNVSFSAVGFTSSLLFLLILSAILGAASLLAVGRWKLNIPGFDLSENGSPEMAKLIPNLSGALPYLLLSIIVASPQSAATPLFITALLLASLLLVLSRLLQTSSSALVALLGTTAIVAQWVAFRFHAMEPWVTLGWIGAFYLLFSAFPFFFRRELIAQTMPWAVSALSGVLLFVPLLPLVERSFPNFYASIAGLLPALFVIVPAACFTLLHREKAPQPPLAWYGGVVLYFITLIFPLQFSHEWLTVAWALEGAALCWLYTRIPLPAVMKTGAALLAIAFVRLALNPTVLSYHPKTVPIFNWHLYTYGVVALACFAAAWFLRNAPPLFRWKGSSIMAALGTILLFLLMNLEIADFFTPRGELVANFLSIRNVTQDLAYSISWALFALGLLGVSLLGIAPKARIPAFALLLITLAKLFLSDLWKLSPALRIAAFIVVPIIAISASFLYQRFNQDESKPL